MDGAGQMRMSLEVMLADIMARLRHGREDLDIARNVEPASAT